ncbi:MAG: AAA family ATPase [Pyrinomonadaceae bacterium]
MSDKTSSSSIPAAEATDLGPTGSAPIIIESLGASLEAKAPKSIKTKAASAAKLAAAAEVVAAEPAHAAKTAAGPTVSGFSVKKMDRAIMELTNDPNFWVSDDNQELLDVVDDLSSTSPQNVLLTGPQGCGKTELSMYFSAKYNRPVIIMNCATVRETKDWFGYRDAKDGSIFWHRSDFVRAVEMGNCVVVLDEFNRLHSTLHNSLYPLLDGRRSTFVEELDSIVVVGPRTVFFATANIGFSHTGTHTMDSAIEDRFGYRLNVDFPQVNKETEIIASKTGLEREKARKLATFGQDIRRKSSGLAATLSRPVSTRQLIQSGILMKKFEQRGLAGTKALDYTILPNYSKEGGRDSEQAQVLQLIQGVFGA